MNTNCNQTNKNRKAHLLNLKDYEIFQTFGCGSFGRVKLAKLRNSEQYFATKVLKKNELIKGNHVKRVLNEIDIFSELNHPFIVNFKGYAQDDRFIYLFMEFIIGGELHKYLENVKKFDLFQASFYASQVVLIFEELHARNILYRDLKPENILITTDGYIKLTDFGFSKKLQNNNESNGRTFTICGTCEYFAPEVIEKKGHCKALDYWTLGVFLYELLIGKTPFYADDPMIIYKNILQQQPKFPKIMDKHAKNLITKLLNKKDTDRLGYQQNSILEIKEHKFFKDIDFESIISKKINAPFQPYINMLDQTSNFDKVEASPKIVMIPIIPSANDPFVIDL